MKYYHGQTDQLSWNIILGKQTRYHEILSWANRPVIMKYYHGQTDQLSWNNYLSWANRPVIISRDPQLINIHYDQQRNLLYQKIEYFTTKNVSPPWCHLWCGSPHLSTDFTFPQQVKGVLCESSKCANNVQINERVNSALPTFYSTLQKNTGCLVSPDSTLSAICKKCSKRWVTRVIIHSPIIANFNHFIIKIHI